VKEESFELRNSRSCARVKHQLTNIAFHPSSRSSALSKFAMPAMSPTMTEGGIASWKKAEGDSFSAGDVLVEIETDKATIDVEAQDDGVLIKIIVSCASN
jgi:pyruvate dehydrogenase E2 component (dihydrolipoamide acetyltransferase)